MTTETIEEFAGFVKIVSPTSNIDGLYPPDLALRLVSALNGLDELDLDDETRMWISDTTMKLASCAEKAEAVRAELRARGYSVPERISTQQSQSMEGKRQGMPSRE
jgi:hypothetical protein